MAAPTLAAISQNLTDAAQAMDVAGEAMREAEKVIRHQRQRISDLEEAGSNAEGIIADLLAENRRLRGEADLLEQADALADLADERRR